MSTDLNDIFKFLDTRTSTERMPVLFVGHGSPMNAINNSPYSRNWQELGRHLPTPRAIVCLSAHWLTDGTYISGIAKPELIYDFYGFPPELYTVQYPVLGHPQLANEIVEKERSIHIDTERGLDHGAWTVLMHLFPNAHIPVLQISIDFEHSRQAQYESIQKLKSLRDAGVLFVGSGNIVHNLGLVRTGEAYSWAEEFDMLSKKLIAEQNIDTLIDIENHTELAPRAIPTDDHYRPMLNTLALLEETESVLFFNETIDLGSISMRSFISIPH